ncbi:MAG: hypothetical protein AB8G26_18170 [Ilumatobacter sp.]
MILEYDPARVARLVDRCREVLGALSALRSTDPAAADAHAAIRRLMRTIESGIFTVADDLRRDDPLSQASPGLPLPMRFPGFGEVGSSVTASPTSTGAADLFNALAMERVLAELIPLSDDELFAALDDEWATMSSGAGTFDGLDPTLSLRLLAFAAEIDRRITEDDSLTQRLTVWATNNPLAAVAVSHVHLAAEATLDVAAALVGDVVSGRTRLGLRSDALERLLSRIGEDPPTALDAIGRPGFVESLVLWDRIASPSFTIGAPHGAALVDAAFSTPQTYEFGTRSDPQETGEATAQAIAALVALTNSELGERGLPGTLSSAYAAGLVPLLPQLVHAFDGDEVFRLRRRDGSPIGVELGATTDSMNDLLGSLSRDADARSALVGSVAVLGGGIGTSYTADQLAGFAVTLGLALQNEEREEELDAGLRRDRIHTALTLLESGLDASRAGGASASVATHAVLGLAGWFVDEVIDQHDIGLGFDPARIEAMLVVGVATRVVADHRRGDGTDETFEEIGRQLDRLDHLDGSTGPDSSLDVDGEVDLLRDLLRRAVTSPALDRDVRDDVARQVAALDHPGLDAPPFRSQGSEPADG